MLDNKRINRSSNDNRALGLGIYWQFTSTLRTRLSCTLSRFAANGILMDCFYPAKNHRVSTTRITLIAIAIMAACGWSLFSVVNGHPISTGRIVTVAFLSLYATASILSSSFWPVLSFSDSSIYRNKFLWPSQSIEFTKITKIETTERNCYIADKRNERIVIDWYRLSEGDRKEVLRRFKEIEEHNLNRGITNG